MLHQTVFRERSKRLAVDEDERRIGALLAAEARQDDLFILVNRERSKRGLPALFLSGELCDLARLQALEMQRENGVRPTAANEHELREILDSPHVAENVCRGPSLRAIHQHSLPEQSKLYCSKYITEVGIGTAEAHDGTIFVCQLFRGQPTY